MAIFPTFFFLRHKGQENVFYDILERKYAFLGYKNKRFKKSKNWHFSKGVKPWFLSKNGHFSNFFLEKLPTESALGLKWNTEEDKFVCEVLEKIH